MIRTRSFGFAAAILFFLAAGDTAVAWLPDISVSAPKYSSSTDSIVLTVMPEGSGAPGLVRIDLRTNRESVVSLPCNRGIPEATIHRDGDAIAAVSLEGDSNGPAAYRLRSISLRNGSNILWPHPIREPTLVSRHRQRPSAVFLSRGDLKQGFRISVADFDTLQEETVWPVSKAISKQFYQLSAPLWIEGDRLVVVATISYGVVPSWTTERIAASGDHYWLITPHTDEIVIHPKDREFGNAESVQRVGGRTVIVGPDAERAESIERIEVIGADGSHKTFPFPPRGFFPPRIIERSDNQLYAVFLDPIAQEVRLNLLADSRLVGKWTYRRLRTVAQNRGCPTPRYD